MQLTHIHQLAGRIELLSGLRIGGGNDEMHIGGIDNPVIKHPYTLEPYLPGSSLKGKMRSLLEWRAGIVGICKGGPVAAEDLAGMNGEQKRQAEAIIRLFGMAGNANREEQGDYGPSRLAFWDCPLAESSRTRIGADNLLFTEAKSENTINRISGVAEHPRQMERVPAGVHFDFRLNLRVLDGDEDSLLDTLLDGLKLLELDSLGGSGSRGYGKIAFRDMTLDGGCIETRLQGRDPFKSCQQAA